MAEKVLSQYRYKSIESYLKEVFEKNYWEGSKYLSKSDLYDIPIYTLLYLQETEELFYQLEGEITVYIQENGEKKGMNLSAGDIFLLPAKVPHSPSRTENSIGLVIEKKRNHLDVKDGLLWFCDTCNHKLHEVYFELNNIENDFLTHFNDFYASVEKRTCNKCGTVMESNPKFVK